MKQHQATLAERPLDAHMIVTAMRYMAATDVPLADILDSVEAGVATFLAERGVDPALATSEDEIAVTLLLCGEVATDILPHLPPPAKAA